MSGGFAEVCRFLGKVCGSWGEVVYYEVYKNLTKKMKTIQWERQEIKYPTQEMLWERCAEVWMMCAEAWERWFIAKFIRTLKIFASKTPKTMWEEILSLENQ